MKKQVNIPQRNICPVELEDVKKIGLTHEERRAIFHNLTLLIEASEKVKTKQAPFFV
ncbi:MAG: hypothetical protein Q8O98_00080 [bacterium]|nr:hypothetical protein [bacterium]